LELNNMWWKDTFLDSTFFTGTITLVVGLVAIGLYFRQKNDQRRDAAKLIAQEIRYAEQTIRIAKEHNYDYYLANKLLPTNSWHKNIHNFVNDLKETDIDLISRFYSHSSYIDIIINKISDKKNDLLVLKNTGSDMVAAPANIKIQEFELSSIAILKDVSEKVEFIYNTPAIDKLRLISEKKYFWFF